MLNLPSKHNHGITLAAVLGMPEHAQLTLQSITTQESIEGVVHAKELMILCKDLCSAAIVKNEVFYVIHQIFWLTKTGTIKYSKLIQFSRIAFLFGFCFSFSTFSHSKKTDTLQQSFPDKFPYH